MSKSKDLKTSPENNMNLYELLSMFSPEKKSKYTEMLIRIMKKTPNIDEHVKEIIENLNSNFHISKEELSAIPKLQIIFFYRILDTMFNFPDLQSFQKFCEYNERGLIKQNDTSKYNSFEEILSSLSIAEIVATNKDLEKQIVVVYDDEEWLLIRPLTFLSSKKYGANTKWCTTQETNPEYFVKYSSKGVLIYCINKKSGYKVASFYSLDKNDKEFSFWNQKDSRIDSLQTELPSSLRDLIGEISKSKDAKTNRFLLTDEERIKEDKSLNSSYNYKIPQEYKTPSNGTGAARVGRAIERVREEEGDVQMEQEMMPREIMPEQERFEGEIEAPQMNVVEAPSTMSFRDLRRNN